VRTHEAWGLGSYCFFNVDPTIHATIDALSRALGMNRRTFTRLFRRETGLSFMAWRQQACILVALPRLAAGEAVTSVAMDLGYDNPAAFTSMFRRSLGSPPHVYLNSSYYKKWFLGLEDMLIAKGFIAAEDVAFLLHPLSLGLFFGFLDDHLVVFASIEVALRAFSASSSAVWSEMLAEVSVAFAVPDVFAADVAHLVSTYASEFVAAR